MRFRVRRSGDWVVFRVPWSSPGLKGLVEGEVVDVSIRRTNPGVAVEPPPEELPTNLSTTFKEHLYAPEYSDPLPPAESTTKGKSRADPAKKAAEADGIGWGIDSDW